jgi:hypothetical protein
MNKPTSLRDFLIKSVAHLRKNPEQLHMFVDSGNLAGRLENGICYQNAYKLNILVLDLTENPASIFVPLLAWVRENQVDIRPDSISYEADILSNNAVDLSITLPLTENVVVNIDNDGKYSLTYPPEPRPDYLNTYSPLDEITGIDNRAEPSE